MKCTLIGLIGLCCFAYANVIVSYICKPFNSLSYFFVYCVYRQHTLLLLTKSILI